MRVIQKDEMLVIKQTEQLGKRRCALLLDYIKTLASDMCIPRYLAVQSVNHRSSTLRQFMSNNSVSFVIAHQ